MNVPAVDPNDKELLSDEALFNLVGEQRDSEALSLLWERLSVQLYRVASYLVHDQSVAQDVLQEALLKIWQAAPRIARARQDSNDQRPVRRLFYSYVRNASVDYLRRNDVRKASVTQREIESLAAKGQTERQLQIADALAKLPPDERALMERYLEGSSYEEIARALNISEANARQRYHRSVRQLARLLR